PPTKRLTKQQHISPEGGKGSGRVLLRDGPHEGRGARLFRPAALAPGSAPAAEGVGAGYAAQLLGVWLGTDHPRLPDGGVGPGRVRLMKMIKVRRLGTSSGPCARWPVRRRAAWLGHDLDMFWR